MAIENLRAQMIANVWQAIAQSGVDLSSLPQDQQEKLVAKIADTALVTMNQILEEQAPNTPAPVDNTSPSSEQVLWEGRPFLSLVETYQLTTQRLRIVRGLLSRNIENIELIRIQDMDYKQGVSERILGIGDIALRGQDSSQENVILRNISKPDEVYEIFRKAWLEARKNYGVQYREYMAPPPAK